MAKKALDWKARPASRTFTGLQLKVRTLEKNKQWRLQNNVEIKEAEHDRDNQTIITKFVATAPSEEILDTLAEKLSIPKNR